MKLFSLFILCKFTISFLFFLSRVKVLLLYGMVYVRRRDIIVNRQNYIPELVPVCESEGGNSCSQVTFPLLQFKTLLLHQEKDSL